MANGLSKSDLEDIDFVDAKELISDGYQTSAGLYLQSTLVDTTSGSKTVQINIPSDLMGLTSPTDHPAESGDYVWLYNTSGGLGDGYYTIDVVIDNTSFTVIESIATSSGGDIQFYYPSGASRVGFNPTGLTNVSAFNIQDALKEVDQAIDAVGGGAPSGPAGGDLDGTYPNPDVVDLTITNEEQGSVLFFDGTNWIQLAPGSNGYVLTTHDTGADPTWEDPGAASLPTADSCGQLLISEEDNIFKPNYPMVGDKEGCILMGDNAIMIICD